MSNVYNKVRKESNSLHIAPFHFKRVLGKKGGTTEMTKKSIGNLQKEIEIVKIKLKQNLKQTKVEKKNCQKLQSKQIISTFVNKSNQSKMWIKYTNKITGKDLYKVYKDGNKLNIKYNNSGELFINI